MFKNLRKISNKIIIYFDDIDKQEADFFEIHIKQSINIIQKTWNLNDPKGLRIYIMDDWKKFIFHSAPLLSCVLFVLFYPFLSTRIKKIWSFCGGWFMPYPGRLTVGIKPARIYRLANTKISEMLFFKEEDEKVKLQNIMCHELTHAYCYKLKLPVWLNEGLAIITAEKYLGKQTVREDSLQMLKSPPDKIKLRSYRHLSNMDDDTIAYHYVKGYWLTLFLLKEYPSILLGLLRKHQSNRVIEKKISNALKVDRKELWEAAPAIVLSHFGGK